MLVAGSDGLAGVWDIAAGDQLFSARGEAYEKPAVAYSRDGSRVAIGFGSDGATSIWNVGRP